MRSGRARSRSSTRSSRGGRRSPSSRPAAGKSLCYQLPALLLDGMTVVVSPLIALMKDQIDFLQRSGIDAERLDSSLDAAEQRAIFDRLRGGTLKLLYVAPERFNNERFLAQLARARISLFAVDEAHCISEWGHNFRPDYLKLAERARELGAERVLALTATATPAVVADIRAGFGIEAARRGRNRLLPAEPDDADDAGRRRRARRACSSSACASGRRGRRSST